MDKITTKSTCFKFYFSMFPQSVFRNSDDAFPLKNLELDFFVELLHQTMRNYIKCLDLGVEIM